MTNIELIEKAAGYIATAVTGGVIWKVITWRLDLREKKVDVDSKQIKDLNERLDKELERNSTLEDKVAKLTKQLGQMQDQITTIMRELEEARSETTKLRGEHTLDDKIKILGGDPHNA